MRALEKVLIIVAEAAFLLIELAAIYRHGLALGKAPISGPISAILGAANHDAGESLISLVRNVVMRALGG